MKNPLLTLDEIVWKQFEKVTQGANKRLGWNKYDLARMMDTAAATSLIGWGGYQSLYSRFDNNYVNIAIYLGTGVLLVGIGYSRYKNSRNENEWLEKQELDELTRAGAAKSPIYDPLRPLTLIGGVILVSGGIDIIGHNDTDNGLVVGLMAMMGGLYAQFITCSNYFRSQIMTPPSKKKSIWKTAYQTVGGWFKSNPKPIEAPAVKYDSIDGLVQNYQAPSQAD